MKIGYALCGSFCTHRKSLEAMRQFISEGHELIPIISENAATTDTRFGTASALKTTLYSLTGIAPVCSIREAEPLGPARPLDALIIAPCTGNTLAKLACGITDTTVCMAAKAHMRTYRPLLIALASNDAMSANLGSIAALLQRKNVYFVPLLQDDPDKKPHSLVADFDTLLPAFHAMLERKQLRPLFKTV